MAIRKELLAELTARREEAMAGGGLDKMEKRRKKGLLTARERLDDLYDKGSLQELGMHVDHDTAGIDHKRLPGDGVVTAFFCSFWPAQEHGFPRRSTLTPLTFPSTALVLT